MAWTVAFALLGALIFSMLLAPVLASFLFPKGTTEWENPLLRWITERYRRAAVWAIEHRLVTFGVAVVLALAALSAVQRGGGLGVSAAPG